MRNTCGTYREQHKSHFYYSFERSMRTILIKTQCGTLAGQTANNTNRNFTTVSGDPCARSYVKHNAAHSRHTRNRNFTTVSGDRCARSYVKHNAEHSQNTRNRNFTTVSGDRCARSYVNYRVPQALVGPGPAP